MRISVRRGTTACMTPTKIILILLLGCSGLISGGKGGRAEYIGGTLQQIPSGCDGTVQAIDPTYFVFYSRKASWRVPYDKINLLEYGQQASRRITAAAIASILTPYGPILLLGKKHKHFLTVGYEDEEGRQQAMIFRVDKNDIRATLVVLEARTGRKVDFQDDEARKAGKG